MPADLRRTLTELQALIEQRATALASQGVEQDQPWVRRLGPPPRDRKACGLGAAGPHDRRLPRPPRHHRQRSARTRAQRPGSTVRLPARHAAAVEHR